MTGTARPPARRMVVIGPGRLGGRLVDLIARSRDLDVALVVAGRDAERATRLLNAARFAASYLERFPDLSFARLDVEDEAATAELIARVRPCLVVNTASRSPWWVRELLPGEVKDRLERVGAGPGLWAAGHLAITRHLVRALADSGCDAPLVNAAYPDVVNPALAGVAPGPLIGIGNLDLMVPAVRYLVAAQFGARPAEVRPRLVAHNFHSARLLAGLDVAGRLPLLRVEVSGRERTAEVDLAALWAAIPRRAAIPLGPDSSAVAVGSLHRTVRALLTGERAAAHAPGVNGLPGGYPIEIDGGTARLDLPPGLDLEAAVAVNLEGQRGEGVETIRPDGTLVFTDTAREVLEDLFAIRAAAVAPHDAQLFSAELGERFSRLASRYGIHLPELGASA